MKFRLMKIPIWDFFNFEVCGLWVNIFRNFQNLLSCRFSVMSRGHVVTWSLYKKNIFFTEGGHMIYQSNGNFALIQNHIRNRVWKWSGKELFMDLCSHVTSRDQIQGIFVAAWQVLNAIYAHKLLPIELYLLLCIHKLRDLTSFSTEMILHL